MSASNAGDAVPAPSLTPSGAFDAPMACRGVFGCACDTQRVHWVSRPRVHACVCVASTAAASSRVRARARPARQAAAGVSKACIESARAWRGGRDIGCSVVYAGAPRGRIGAGAGVVPPRAGRCIAPRTPRVRAPGCFVPPVCVYVSAVDVHFDICVCVDMHVDVCMRARCNGVHACVCV